MYLTRNTSCPHRIEKTIVGDKDCCQCEYYGVYTSDERLVLCRCEVPELKETKNSNENHLQEMFDRYLDLNQEVVDLKEEVNSLKESQLIGSIIFAFATITLSVSIIITNI